MDRRMDLLSANDRPGTHPRTWYAATTPPLAPFPPLEGRAEADVCVVGGGYTGLSAALHLAEAGYSVVLLEAQRVGWGASGRNGGQVGSGQRQDQDWLEAAVGRGRARALWDLGEEAKALVRRLAERAGADCDLREGVAQVAHKRRLAPAFHAYGEKLARDYGYRDIAPLDAAAAADLLGTDVFHDGLLDRGAFHLQPLAFAFGLARDAAAAGVAIHETSRATSIEPVRKRGRAATRIAAGRGEVVAPFAVLAANGYLGGLASAVAARAMPINNFIVATEPLARPPIPTGVAAADSRFVVNYWRTSRDGRLIFGGGESYGYRFPRDIARTVRRPLARVYPDLADARIDYAWGGTLAITTNRLPAFQRLGPGVFSAAGYSGHGVGAATLAGRIIAEAVRGTAERFDLFADLPQRRFPGGASLRWPLLVLAMTWYGLRDRL
jgi:gamma-glutamylputrescine oxidase